MYFDKANKSKQDVCPWPFEQHIKMFSDLPPVLAGRLSFTRKNVRVEYKVQSLLLGCICIWFLQCFI